MPFTRRSSRLASQGTPAPATPVRLATQHEVATDLEAATPKAKSALAFLSSITHRTPKTPKEKSPIKPTDPEMHPQKNHRTSTTPYDEARWLGFFNKGAQTDPAAQTASFTAAETSPTPAKMALPTPAPLVAITASSPDFKFTFRRAPSVELSEDAQKIMAESREEAAKIRAQLAALPSVPDTEPEVELGLGRKIAKPKGKAGRYSDVHMENFKKMDSIANHASAWRADPSRIKPVVAPLKRSPSKAELDKPSITGSLKRSPSKAELTKPNVHALKRSPSKAELDKPVVHTLQRSPSKPTLKKMESNSFLYRSATKTATSHTPDERPIPSAKRVKHVKEDDAGTTRLKQAESPALATPPRQQPALVRSKSGLLRPGFSSAMSPTKSSMARKQSMQDLKTTTQVPALIRSTTSNTLHQAQPSTLPRSKSMRDLTAARTPRAHLNPLSLTASTPTPVKTAFLPYTSPLKAPELLTSSPGSTGTPKRIKSILRTPNRRYTRDPIKIAAGTHHATPPQKTELYPTIPATEPVIKRVNFTNSTKEKAERDAIKAASVEPESVAYPSLIIDDNNRRSTLCVMPTLPGAFTFRSDREVSFGSPNSGTIRQVRPSDIGLPPAFQFTGVHISSPSKRKLDTLDEAAESEKENQDDGEQQRPAKKARFISESKSAPTTPMRKSPTKSLLPRFGSKRASGLTAARLSMLAKPKRRG